MSYAESLEYLYRSQPAFHLVGAAAYKPGLDNTLALMDHLGHPYRSFRSVHIAGTNGKGSTSHLIAATLQAAGLKTGLYTSPHLIDFRERIRINGAMIPESRVAEFVETNRDFLDAVKPSFFETTMALAFQYFADEKVDIAVVEVGLGGRLDSTNILTPILSVITNIGMDHTEFLGDTLAKIASEKAGIIKPGVPCVIGETDPETMPVFLEKARACGILGGGLETTDCRIFFADQCGFLRRCRRRDVTECQLQGSYQEKNMQTAYVALRQLQAQGLPLSRQSIAEGFALVCTMTGLRGRWEILRRQPLTICDTGHNSHGLKYVAEQLKRLKEEKYQLSNNRSNDREIRTVNCQLRIVFGMVDDKDVDVVMRLLPRDAVYYFTQAKTHRAIPAARMLELWQKELAKEELSIINYQFSTVEEALLAAQKEATDEDIIFIGGSNYVVGEALTYF
ncbi:MAG: bifunctional folylpolyglutamate synthase/dihydrofolate synthase [Paludibacteraceae bacterium]|nr:bifunctional folylpolyglutamate synthase/dihydrofolate synthase [Paludibacteraceae bacterium]